MNADECAKKLGFDQAEYLGVWKGMKAYCGAMDAPYACIGLPVYILEDADGNARVATEEEGMAMGEAADAGALGDMPVESSAEAMDASRPDTLSLDAAPSMRSKDANGFLHVASSNISKEVVNPYYGREIPGWEERASTRTTSSTATGRARNWPRRPRPSTACPCSSTTTSRTRRTRRRSTA